MPPALDPPTLRLLDPDLFAATQRFAARYPALRRIAWRGAMLVHGRHLAETLPTDNAFAMVRSASNPALSYALTWEGDAPRCDCPSWAANAPCGPHGGPLCKHLVGYLLLCKVGRSLEGAKAAEDVWAQLHECLREQLRPATWSLLWARLRLDGAVSSPTKLVLTSDSRIAVTWLHKPRWRQPVQRIACEIAGRRLTVEIVAEMNEVLFNDRERVASAGC